VVVANLQPRKLMGVLSHGMLLAATGEDGLPNSAQRGWAA